LQAGLASWFLFYNEERIHSALDYQTPDVVYEAAGGIAEVLSK